MKRRKGKGRTKTVVYTNLKQTSTKCDLALIWCVRQYWEKCHKKRHMDEFINVFHAFINNISRYIATSCDLKKRAKSSFFILMFFYLSIVLDSP